MMLTQRLHPRWTTRYVHCPHSYSGCTHLGGASNCLCEQFLLIIFFSFILYTIFRCILFCQQSSKKGEIVGANILPPCVLEIVDRNSHGLTRMLVLSDNIVHADFEENDNSEGILEDHFRKSWAQKFVCRSGIHFMTHEWRVTALKVIAVAKPNWFKVTRRNW